MRRATAPNRAFALGVAALLVVVTHEFSLSAVAPVPVAVRAAAGAGAKGGGMRYGDLTHLTYTATGALPVSFVSPAENYASPSSAAQVTVSTVRGAGVELAVDGEIVSLEHLGKRTVNVKTGETQYFFYGVPVGPGPNTVTATGLGARGSRGETISETIYGPGEPASVRVALSAPLVADGTTARRLTVRVFDRFGHAAIPGARIRVTLVRGDARFESAASKPAATPAPAGGARGRAVEQPLGVGGVVDIPIVPGLLPGGIELHVIAGQVSETQEFYVYPFLRKPIVDGLASVGMGAVPGPVNGDGLYDGGGSKRQRLAFFATGQIGKRTLATIAYESQNRLAPVSSFGPYVQDPNERPYLTYGDSSTLSSDFHSNDHLYARIDRGRDSAMWGQFVADTGMPDVAAFHELLSGAKVDVTAGRGGRTRVLAFTARDDVAYVATTVPVTGLSTIPQPLQPDIVVGSDYLTLVTLDRRTGAVIAQTPLIRNVDYTIDYATGTLRFINIPLPYDDRFNPQAIEITYQYEGPGVRSRTTGGSVQFGIGRGGATQLRLGYINDANGSQNFALFSQSISQKLRGGGWTLTHATSRGAVPNPIDPFPAGTGGDALSFMLTESTPRDRLDASYESTSSGFANPFGGLSAPGLQSYRLAWTRATPNRSSLSIAVDGQTNRGFGQAAAQGDLTVAFQRFLSRRLSVLLGFDEHRQSIGTPQTRPTAAPSPGAPAFASGTQSQVQLGVDYKATDRLALHVQQNLTVGGKDAGSTMPTQTMAQLSYDLKKHGRFYVRELLSDQPASSFADSTANLMYGSASTRSTQIGFERALSPATTVSSDYLIDGTGSSKDIYSALGVHEKFKIGHDLGGNFFVQSAAAVGRNAQGFSVWGGVLDYANAGTLRASLGYQTRSGFAGGSTLSGGIAGHISPNVSIVGTIAHAYSPGNVAINDRLSLAYRPARNDRFISLFDYRRTTGNGYAFGSLGDVASLEEIFRPGGGFELAGRAAYKLDGGGYYVARTAMLSLRARQNLGPRFDVGAALRQIFVPQVSGGRTSDLAVEVGYQLGNSARLAVGYNLSTAADPTLTGAPQRKGLYVTLTTLIDRIFGWGK